MVYDYVTTKPELNEETLAHYGIKGMKWRKHLKGRYYSMKSKLGEKKTKFTRTMNMIGKDYVTTDNGKKIVTTSKNQYRKPIGIESISNAGKPNNKRRLVLKDDGKAGSHSGREGLRDVLTTKVGKKDRPLARKKKVVAGKGSVKKRK